MSTDSDDVTAMAHVTKEFTFIDPLSDGECMALIQTAEADNIKIIITESRRIVLFPCDDLHTATAILAEVNLIESIGLIREIVEWDITGLVSEYELPIQLTPEGNDNDQI